MSVRDLQILDAVPLMIFATDMDGVVVQHNHSAALHHGIGAVGQPLHRLLGDTAAETQIDRAFQTLGTSAVPLVRWEFADRGTDDRVLLVQVTRRMDAGAHVGFVATVSDVSESHRAREALISTGLALASSIDLARVYREVGQQLQRAVRCVAYVIAVADDDTLVLSSVQRSGFPETPAQLENRLRADWLQALATGSTVTHRNDGAGPEISAPILSEEGIVGAITVRLASVEGVYELAEIQRILSAISAQTAAAIDRAYLVHRVEQKRRLEAIGEVSAGVAHELRNPLFGISSAAQLLRLRSRDDAAVERNVQRILREVDRLNTMLSALLVYGRPPTLQLAPHNPDTILDEIIESNRAQLDAAALRLVRERAASDVVLHIDAAQMGQVFLNVLVNAIDAAPVGSTITVHSAPHGSGAWRCRVHNGGQAIPPEALPRVFEIFFSMKSGGTGIGLALCRRIIDDHNGTITIDSQADQGTAVTIVLPAGSA
jgi:signal transduction histidine kinase